MTSPAPGLAAHLDRLVRMAHAGASQAELERAATAAAAGLARDEVLEAGFETSDYVDERGLIGRLHAHGVDRVLVAGGTPAASLEAFARALAGPPAALTEPEGVRVEYLPPLPATQEPPPRPVQEGPIRLLGPDDDADRPRPRTALDREVDVLRRAVAAAASRGAASEALHAAQALIQLQGRVPEVERRSFGILVRRALPPAVLHALAEEALRRPEEQDRAAEVLVWVGAPAADVLVDHLRVPGREAAVPFVQRVLAGMPAAVPLLVPLLEGGGGASRQAAQLLGGIGGTAARDALRAALTHADAGTRVSAAAALLQLGEPGLVMPLLGALEHETDPQARQALLRLVAGAGDPHVEEGLVRLLRRGYWLGGGWPRAERVAAVAALAEVPGVLGARVLDRLGDGRGAVARAARLAARTLRGTTSPR